MEQPANRLRKKALGLPKTICFFFFTSSLGLEPARARWAQRMGRDPPPVLPGRLAAEEAPAEEAAEVWVLVSKQGAR